MSAPITSAPKTITDSPSAEMAVDTPSEISCLIKANVMPEEYTSSGVCSKLVRIGLFFDGTNNNRDRDEPVQGHTNVVKLFNAHKDNDEKGFLKHPDCYRFYVPGVGTRFPENQEWTESQDGKAMGKGAQARILYGVLQVYNAVFRAFNDNRFLYGVAEITEKIRSYERKVEHNYDQEHTQYIRRQHWFEQLRNELNERVQHARNLISQPKIPLIRVSVFGFSRGAIEARGFCYWLDAALGGTGKLAGMPIEIKFLGLFDSVASIGLPDSTSRTTPLKFADGHFDWAAETLKPLPSLVKNTLHYIAAHEQRMNFPVTRVLGDNVREVLYPGMHSDVGGGYCPGEQGRGMSVGQMISQVPLLHMHKAARLAGVPLVSYGIMDERLQKDYALSPELAANWNAYMAESKFEGSYEAQVSEHMRRYYLFRRHWAKSMREMPACRRASPQEQEDLFSYNLLMLGDLELLRRRAKSDPPKLDSYGHPVRYNVPGNDQRANLRALQRMDARAALDTWEKFALAIFDDTNDIFEPPGIALLREQIHDSLAGFYLAGYTGKQEMAEALLRWQRRPPPPTSRYDHAAWTNFQRAKKNNPEMQRILDQKAELEKQAESARFNGRIEDYDAMKRRAVFSEKEAALLSQDANGEPIFPLQTDSDAKELRSAFITTQTASRREGGGYFVPRKVFLP